MIGLEGGSMKDPSGVEAKEFGLTDPLDLLPIYFKSEVRDFPGSPEVSLLSRQG